MKSFTKLKNDIFKYATVQLLSKGLSLLANYIIALLSTNEIFGYIALLQASFLVAITFFGFNLQSSFVRYYFSVNLYKIIKLTKPIFLFLFIFSTLLTFILFFTLNTGSKYYFFYLLPIIGFFSSIGFIISMLARSNGNFWIYAFSELFRPISLIFLSLFLFTFEFDIIKIYIYILFFSGIVVFIFGLLNLKKLIYKGPISSIEFLTTKIILIYTFPLFLSQIMSLVNNVSDKYILNIYLDISHVGIYGKAYIFGSSLGLLFDSLILLWVPYVIKYKELIFKRYLKLLLKIVYFVFVLSFLVFFSGLFVYYSNFEIFSLDNEFISIFIIVVSAFISRIGYQILTPVLNAYDQTAVVAKCSIISMVLGLLFNLIFIPYIGIIAAALSTLISFFCYSLMSVFFIKKLHKSFNNI